MPLELRPLARALGLRPERRGAAVVHAARAPGVDWVAVTTGIGTRAAAEAAERLLGAAAVDLAVVVGIAGGVAPHARIGALIAPELVVDGASGREHRPAPLPGLAARGILRTGDDVVMVPGRVAALAAHGVVALDMETSAIAAVCARRGTRWSVVRAISDMAGETPAAVLGLAGPDGARNAAALFRYLAPAPWRALGLVRLARDSARAARIAADAAVRAVEAEVALAETAGALAPR